VGQTVEVPEVRTTLQGDAGHESDTTPETVTLTDTISYKGLKAGTTYAATGTLHYVSVDVTDAGIVTDAPTARGAQPPRPSPSRRPRAPWT
jgi:hypothetical protein